MGCSILQGSEAGNATKALLLAISQRVSNMPAYRGVAIEVCIRDLDDAQVVTSNVSMMCFLDNRHRSLDYYRTCVANTLCKLAYNYTVDGSDTFVELGTFVPGVYRFAYNNTFRRRWIKVNEIVS